MIKIIKEGKNSFITTCPKCGCEFTYELADIIASSVYCPCCGNSVIHEKQDGSEHKACDKYGSYYGPDYTTHIVKTATATNTSEK